MTKTRMTNDECLAFFVIRHSSFVISFSTAMSTDSAKVAFLFPGQGAQTVGMGAAVCAQGAGGAGAVRSGVARARLRSCTSSAPKGRRTKLDSTVHSQPALFVASLAALEQLKQDSPELVDRCVGGGRT